MYYQNGGYQGFPQPDAYGTARRTALLRHKIVKAQAKAKLVGILYLLASIAIAALACLPMLTLDGTAEGNLWVLTFWKPFLQIKSISTFTPQQWISLVVSVFYALILLTVAINLLRSFGKLKWLFKRRPSRLNGYNRNVFAMEDMGKLFSSSFYVLLAFTFLIYLLTKSSGTKLVIAPPYAIVAAGLGIVIHFLCGAVGGSIHLYVVENGMIEEERRKGSVLVPVIRNLIQLGVVGAIAWFMLQTNAIATLLHILVSRNFAAITQNPVASIYPVAHLLVFLCWLVLLKHATGIAEYDRDGAYAAGALVFRSFAFITVLVAGGAVAVQFYLTQQFVRDCLFIALIALLAFVIELILRKYPSDKVEDFEDIEVEDFIDSANAMVPQRYGYPQAGYPAQPFPPYGAPQTGYPQAGYGAPEYDFYYEGIDD